MRRDAIPNQTKERRQKKEKKKKEKIKKEKIKKEKKKKNTGLIQPQTNSCRITGPSNDAAQVSEQTQRDVLDARANFRLRNDVVESVMTANPILKAVHNGTNATPAER